MTAHEQAALAAVKAAYPWTRRANLSITVSTLKHSKDGNTRCHVDTTNCGWRIKFDGASTTILDLMEW